MGGGRQWTGVPSKYRAEAINDDKDGDEALKRTKTDEEGDGGKRQSQCI